jgi:hypothetical protein
LCTYVCSALSLTVSLLTGSCLDSPQETVPARTHAQGGHVQCKTVRPKLHSDQGHPRPHASCDKQGTPHTPNLNPSPPPPPHPLPFRTNAAKPLFADAYYVSFSIRAQPSTESIQRWSPAAKCGVSLRVCLVRSVDKAVVCRPLHGPAACVLSSSTRSTRLP